MTGQINYLAALARYAPDSVPAAIAAYEPKPKARRTGYWPFPRSAKRRPLRPAVA
jgi:hypothetical protein